VSHHIADLLEAGIQCCAGIWITLVAYGVIAAPARIEGMRRFLKVGGPLLIAIAIALAVTNLRTPTIARNWQRVATTDGCSVEFPQPPKHETKLIAGLPTETQSLYLEAIDQDFRLSAVEIPADAPPATDDQRIDMIRDSMIANSKNYVLVGDRKLTDRAVAGRELELVVNDTHTMRMRIYVSGRRSCRAIIAMPKSSSDQDANHFLESFRFTP
jgi:hypothetical protein